MPSSAELRDAEYESTLECEEYERQAASLTREGLRFLIDTDPLMGDPSFYGHSPDPDETPVDGDADEREALQRYESLLRAYRAGRLTGDSARLYAGQVFYDTGCDYEDVATLPSVSAWNIANDDNTVAWLRRDELELEAEVTTDRRLDAADVWLAAAEKRSTPQRLRVRGDSYPRGVEGERQWLGEVTGQLRVDWAAGDAAMRKMVERKAKALRHRFNFNRYVEALELDPREALARKAKARLSYAACNERFEQHASYKRQYEDFSVPGLIAA